MANETELRQVLEWVEAHPEQVNRSSWQDCFAGHTIRLLTDVDPDTRTGMWIWDTATSLLGLTDLQARELFIESIERGYRTVVERILGDQDSIDG